MPRKALRCVVELNIHAVTAPGVWLPSREDVYLSFSIFGQYRNTQLLTSEFPLLIHEKFWFERTFYSALDPSEVTSFLEDELVIFELVQLSEYCDGAVRLASYSTNARDFLFPILSLAPKYTSTDREILFCRTVAFPGISPKLEFSTKTDIRDSFYPQWDATGDALEYSRFGRQHYNRRTSKRARSTSPGRRYATFDLDDRPPFLVRKLSPELIGRTPGGGPDKHAFSRHKGKSYQKALSRSSDDLDIGKPVDCISCFKDENRCSKPDYKSTKRENDIDNEVAELTSPSCKTSGSCYRPRSASPLLTRPSFSERYGRLPPYTYTPTYSAAYYEALSDRVRKDMEWKYRLERLNSPYFPYWRYDRYDPILDCPHYRSPWYDSMHDLDFATRMARLRRRSPSY